MNRLLKTTPGALAGRRLEQMMLSGAGDSLGPVADIEFVVAAVEIPLDGADRNEECGPSGREQKEAARGALTP